MRYVSEQFKNALDEIIRPATKLFFEVDTNVANGEYIPEDIENCFDTTVAPFTRPKTCINEHYYAVLGDDTPIDDPNKICAPDDLLGYAKPTIPIGISAEIAANTEFLIGDTLTYYNNFIGIVSPTTFCFKGLVPDYMRVEIYDADNGVWLTEVEISNPDLNNEITYTPSDYSKSGSFRRFVVKNTTTAGRFQLLWIREDFSVRDEGMPVVFTDSHISSINISEDTDLTSQTLPSYEMTVECLDVNEEYTPESAYWGKQFAEGSPCYFKLGYEFGGETEYIPFMYGKLTQAPDYEDGKITFKVTTQLAFSWSVDIDSIPDSALNEGDLVNNTRFIDLIEENNSGSDILFDTYNVFTDTDDEDNSVCNYYGVLESNEARQLIANALGSFITCGIDTVDLTNVNKIQYNDVADTLSRYGQIKATLESKNKVGKINVTRNENRLLADSASVEADTYYSVVPDEYTYITFNIPFWAVGKIVVTNYQKTNPSANITLEDWNIWEGLKKDGTIEIDLCFTADDNTDIKPIVSFYKIGNEKFTEIGNGGKDNGETYQNDNDLITCSWTAEKVKRVARLIGDMSDQYDVDFVQDYRYEVGDIIRLETQEGVYKTCVITSLNFKLPGSSGHLTCRRIFSFYDSPYSVFEAIGMNVVLGTTTITVLEMNEKACVVGRMNTPNDTYIYVLGVERLNEEVGGVDTEKAYNGTLTDLNDHAWHFAYYVVPSGTEVTTGAPILELPSYSVSTGATIGAYGAISLLKALYSEQGMTAPVDWDCDWQAT